MLTVKLLEYPSAAEWLEVKRRALVTMNLEPKTAPTEEWKRSILRARHSPIRYLRFCFYIECPSWVSVHMVRHVHAQPYVASQRNDRQIVYDRNAARQDVPVKMIFDVNAEELITIANKRLCKQAAKETRELVSAMCSETLKYCPEFEKELVPMCERNGGVCYEMKPCGKYTGGE